MREPADLKKEKLKDNPLPSDVVEQHAKEATISHEIREQLLGLQDWVRRMKKAAEEKK